MAVDSDITLSTFDEDVSSEYALSYLESFLPVYQLVNQSALSNVDDRYHAIRFAADASLALTASGASWSAALGQRLGDACADEGTVCGFPCEDRLSVRLECDWNARDPSFSPEIFPTVEETSGESSCESGDRTEGGEWRVKTEVNSSEQVPDSAGGMNVLVGFKGNETNFGRNQRYSRASHRLAILRKLSTKVKSRRRLLQASWKPRSVRKTKSSLGARRRIASLPLQVDVVAPERTFENGISALQRLVPGGLNMDAGVLLDEAVDFVMFLKLQVQALQSVAKVVDERFGTIVSVV